MARGPFARRQAALLADGRCSVERCGTVEPSSNCAERGGFCVPPQGALGRADRTGPTRSLDACVGGTRATKRGGEGDPRRQSPGIPRLSVGRPGAIASVERGQVGERPRERRGPPPHSGRHSGTLATIRGDSCAAGGTNPWRRTPVRGVAGNGVFDRLSDELRFGQEDRRDAAHSGVVGTRVDPRDRRPTAAGWV